MALPKAGHAGPFGIGEGATLAERTQDLGLVNASSDNSAVHEVWILGRYHGQYYSTDATVTQPRKLPRLGRYIRELFAQHIAGRGVAKGAAEVVNESLGHLVRSSPQWP